MCCVCVCGLSLLSPSSSQSCLYLSVMVVPCCLHSASRGSAMNCSVISVNILAPLESRIFSISLTCSGSGRWEGEGWRRQRGQLPTHPHATEVYTNSSSVDGCTNRHGDRKAHQKTHILGTKSHSKGVTDSWSTLVTTVRFMTFNFFSQVEITI